MLRRLALLCVGLVMTAFAAGCHDRGRAPPAPLPHGAPSSEGAGTSSAAHRFLATYVTADGRVLRRDQGGDIVSESQAYGMLIAEIAGRTSTAHTIWRWTAAHLARPDGLLQYHASGTGQVQSSEPATDADVLLAYALLRYRGTDQAALNRAGRRIAQSVLSEESTTVDGAPVLVAGPWALAMSPPVVNPSYWMPSVFDAIAAYTGDGRWRAAARVAVKLLADVTRDGRQLPPDWARLAKGRLVPIADPSGRAPEQYGLDAARLPVWFAAACDPTARQLADSWWTNVLHVPGRAADLALTLTGMPINQQTNPLPLLAGAAAAAAAGDEGASGSLRAAAAQQARRQPTYYGDAWLALDEAIRQRALDPCREAPAR